VSQVNLLPPELRQKQAVRRTTAVVAFVGLAVIAAILGFYFLQSMRLSSAQDELAAQESTNASLQSEIQDLQPYADLQTQLAQQQALVNLVYQNEVAWSSVLGDVSRIIPDESYLTNFSGTLATTEAGVTPGTATSSVIGTVTFSGVARETETIASWLTRLGEVPGWVNAWVDNAAESGAFTRIYAFDGGLDLTSEAATARGRGEGTGR
jgi:Tfp pilus assembly protein PilN